MTVESEALFLTEGLLCLVMDYDKVGDDEMLGMVTISPKTLYYANGERLEFKLRPPPLGKAEDDVPGWLAIRCRRASEYDKKFMREYYESEVAEETPEGLELKNIVKHATESAGGGGNLKTLITRVERTVRDKDNPKGIKQVR